MDVGPRRHKKIKKGVARFEKKSAANLGWFTVKKKKEDVRWLLKEGVLASNSKISIRLGQGKKGKERSASKEGKEREERRSKKARPIRREFHWPGCGNPRHPIQNPRIRFKGRKRGDEVVRAWG